VSRNCQSGITIYEIKQGSYKWNDFAMASSFKGLMSLIAVIDMGVMWIMSKRIEIYLEWPDQKEERFARTLKQLVMETQCIAQLA
jgi:hypothetical protein